jgi:hypothetical protein
MFDEWPARPNAIEQQDSRSSLLTAVLFTAALPGCSKPGKDTRAQRPEKSGIDAAPCAPPLADPTAVGTVWPQTLAGPGPVTNRLHSSNGAASIYGYVGDYTNPILKPQAAVGSAHAPSPRTQCWPGDVPFVFTNVGMQMFQQPDKITIFYSDNHEALRAHERVSSGATDAVLV